MILQTNDTDHHEHVRKRSIELQTELMISKTRMQGGGMAECSLEENIEIMIEVMSSEELHLIASEGYKLTGATVALNGDEDDRIKREAGIFWGELEMRSAVNFAVADVEKRFEDKLLPWNYKTVMGEITPYPHKNCLDTLLVGQEDEATVDPDKHKWDEDGDASIMGAADESDDEIMDFDPKDWVRGEEARVTYAVAVDTYAQRHGHGGSV